MFLISWDSEALLVNNLLCTYPIYAMQVKTIWYQSNEETLSARL